MWETLMILVAKGQQYWAYKPPKIVEIFQSCPPSNVISSGDAKKLLGLAFCGPLHGTSLGSPISVAQL